MIGSSRPRPRSPASGRRPVSLAVEPYGLELAGPVRDVVSESSAPIEPDPQGRISRDEQRLIEAELVVVPSAGPSGQAARVHITFRAVVALNSCAGITNRLRCGSGSPAPRAGRSPLGYWKRRRASSQSRLKCVASISRRSPLPDAQGKDCASGPMPYTTHARRRADVASFLRQDLTIDLNVAK